MITRHSNEDAIAYGWFMVVVFLILGSIAWMAMTTDINNVLTIANKHITEGKMSQQTKNTMEFNRQIAMYLPVVMLIGAFIWAMLRSIGGSGATFQAFYTGYIIFFLCCIIGFMMAFTGGLVIDRLFTSIGLIGLDTPAKMTQAWYDARESTMWWFINAYYFLCCFVSVIGGAVFFQSIVRNTFGNRYVR